MHPALDMSILMEGPVSDRPMRMADILAICLLLALSSTYSYRLFHTLVELFTIGVAFAIMLLAWHSREMQDIGFLKIIAMGFGAAASIDLLHTLAYKGMNIFPGYDANLPTQLWISARYLQALCFLVAPLLAPRRPRFGWLAAAYGVLTLLLVLAIFAGYFPACYVEGKGLTPFKVTSEYIIVALILAAAVLLYRGRARLKPTTYRFLRAMALVTVAQELAFTAYMGVYDLANMVGHLLKLVAYYLLYRAIFVAGFRDPFLRLFRDLKAVEMSPLASQEAVPAFAGALAASPLEIGPSKVGPPASNPSAFRPTMGGQPAAAPPEVGPPEVGPPAVASPVVALPEVKPTTVRPSTADFPEVNPLVVADESDLASDRYVLILQQARDSILADLVNPPDLATLVRQCGTNRTTLQKLFQAEFGMSVFAYVREQRLQRARALLASGHSIDSVAGAVGYGHSQNFSRAFKQRFGLPPSQL